MSIATAQTVAATELKIMRPQQEAVGLLSYSAFLIALSAITGLLIRTHPLPLYSGTYFTHDLWYLLMFKLVGMLSVPMAWFYLSGYRFSDLQPRWRITAKSIAWIVAAYLIGASINASYIQSIKNAYQSGIFPDAGVRIAVGLAAPLLTAGLPEEFFFRGLLQTRLEVLWGRVAAIVVAVTLFTAWHLPTRFLLSNGVEGRAGDFGSVLLHTGAPVFVVGLILAVLYDRYRSLVPLIALHWGIDTLPAVASFLGIHR